MDNKKVFGMMGLFALLLVSIVVSQYYNALSRGELGKKRKAEYGQLHFTGKVVHYRVYKYMNKNFYQVCVKLDSPNAKPMLIYNDDDALKINNGIATFSAGFLNHTLGPADSIAVNADKSDKIVLHYKVNAVENKDFEFDKMGLLRSDLDSCK